MRLVGDKARIRQHSERACAALDAVADAFLCIVRGAERADLQVLDGKGLIRGKGMQIRRGIVERGSGAKTCVERDRMLFLQRTQTAHMVNVLVRDEDTVQIIEREGKCRERLRDAAAGDARVDEKVGIVVTDERGVAGARTGEGVKFHGSIPLSLFFKIIPQPRAIVKKKKPPRGGLRGRRKRCQPAGKASPAMKPFSPVQTMSPAASTPPQTYRSA